MAASRNSKATTSRFAFGLSLAMLSAGCGGNPPEVDTAETIRTEPAVKPTPTPEPAPTPGPAVEPAKDAPKG